MLSLGQNNCVTKFSLLMLFLPFCLEEVDTVSKESAGAYMSWYQSLYDVLEATVNCPMPRSHSSTAHISSNSPLHPQERPLFTTSYCPGAPPSPFSFLFSVNALLKGFLSSPHHKIGQSDELWPALRHSVCSTASIKFYESGVFWGNALMLVMSDP